MEQGDYKKLATKLDKIQEGVNSSTHSNYSFRCNAVVVMEQAIGKLFLQAAADRERIFVSNHLDGYVILIFMYQ